MYVELTIEEAMIVCAALEASSEDAKKGREEAMGRTMAGIGYNVQKQVRETYTQEQIQESFRGMEKRYAIKV